MYFTATVVLSLYSTALARPVRFHRRAAALDTGSCGSPQIEFANGLDGRTEAAFQTVNQQDFNHGSAQKIGIIADFVCGQLQTKCKASADTVAACDQGTQAAAQATDGAAADAFNAALGITSNFAAGAADGAAATSGATNTDTAGANATAASGSTQNTTAASNTDSTTASNSTSGVAGAVALDTGSCGSPEIQFADGLDGRNEASFQAINQQDFNHGSALNIGVIADFVCGQLQNKCKASADTVAACDTATQDTAKATGGAAADAFNAALGITSNFAAGAADGGTSNAGAGNATATDGASNSSAANAGSSSAAAPANSTAAATPAAAGDNLQTFTGALGATPPAVTALGGGQFQVDGNASFNNLQNALVRSCDVQHNQCANAANASGNSGDLTVSACGTQQDQCNSQAESTAAA